jgi:hypothetical protein
MITDNMLGKEFVQSTVCAHVKFAESINVADKCNR